MRVCLPVQGTWVQSLVREDATCLRAATPVSHNYEVHMLQVLKPECLEPGLASKRGRHSDDPCPAEYSPLAATGEGLCEASKTQHSQK